MSDRISTERVKKRPKRKVPKPTGLSVATFLRKFVELSILAALIGTVISFPVELPTRYLSRLSTWVAEINGGSMPAVTDVTAAGFVGDLLTLFSGSMPLWEHRVGIFALLAFIGVGAHVCARVYEWGSGRPVFEDPSRAPRRDRNAWRRRLFFFAMLGLVSHAFLSYFWGGWVAFLPSIDTHAYGAELNHLTTSRMPRALEGAVILSLAFAWFLAAEDVVRSRRFVYSLLALMIFSGVVVSVTAIAVQRPHGSEILPGALASAPLGATSTWLPPFLIPPILLAWTILCIGRTSLVGWDRVGLALAIAVMVTALLEWGDLPSLIVALGGFTMLVWLLQRRAGVEFSMRAVVGVPLVVGALIGFLSMIGDPPRAFLWNEFLGGDGGAGQQPVRLGVNDRLRVLFVSIPMVLENPILGSGWGSFNYVYPEARARFFSLHPDTILAPAPFGLSHARSDALQLLFECGFVGALMTVGGVYMLLAAGWGSLRGCVRQEHVTLQLGIFSSIIVLLVFAMIESALRLPTVAATVLVMMAVWGNGERLWRLEVPRLEERVEGLADLEREDDSMVHSSDRLVKPSRVGLAMSGGVTMAIAAMIVAFSTAGGQWFSGRVALARGMHNLTQASAPGLAPGNRRDWLYSANGSLDNARRLQPQAGDVLFASARLQLAFARDKIDEADLREGEEPTIFQPPDVLRRLALNDAQQGLLLLDEAALTLRGKELFRVRAVLLAAAAAATDGDSTELSREALRALGEAVRLNPGDPEPVVTLVQWTRSSDVPTEQNMLDLYAFLYRYHPPEFKTHVMGYVERLHALSNDAEAYREMRRVATVNPTDPALRLARARAAFFAGDLGLANSEASQLRVEGNAGADLLDAMIAAREGAFSRAMTDASSITPQAVVAADSEWTEVFLAILATRDGGPEGRAAGIARLRADYANRPETLATLARVLSSVFQDHRTALTIIREVTARPDATARSWAVLADVLVRSEAGVLLLLRQPEHQPVGSPPAWERVRTATARARLTEAVGHLATAVSVSDNEEDRLILRQRMRRLESLLPPAERRGAADRADEVDEVD